MQQIPVELKGSLYKRKDFVGKEEDAKSHPNRTYYYRKNVDVGALIDSCTRKLQTDPTNAKALYIRASSFMKQNSFPEAVRDYTNALQINPRDVGSLYNRGIAQEKLGRTQESINDYTAVLKIDPNHVNAAYARAACHNREGQFSKAIEDYNFALQKDQELRVNNNSNTNNKTTPKGKGSITTPRSPSSRKRVGSFAVGAKAYAETRERELRAEIMQTPPSSPPRNSSGKVSNRKSRNSSKKLYLDATSPRAMGKYFKAKERHANGAL